MKTAIARKLLALRGWTVTMDRPQSQRYVLIVAPHTSNWDFPLGIAAAHALDLKVHWMGKHTLFARPFGWFFKAIGGIPVERKGSHDLIRQMTDLFANSESLILALAPEGTRSRTDHWKSGFYHIAKAAQVPIVMAYLDHTNKEIGLGGEFLPGDDSEADFKTIRRYFAGRNGRLPELASDIRFRSG